MIGTTSPQFNIAGVDEKTALEVLATMFADTSSEVCYNLPCVIGVWSHCLHSLFLSHGQIHKMAVKTMQETLRNQDHRPPMEATEASPRRDMPKGVTTPSHEATSESSKTKAAGARKTMLMEHRQKHMEISLYKRRDNSVRDHEMFSTHYKTAL